MTQPEIFTLLHLIADRLNRLDVPFLVGGSIASSVFGEPRMTRDIDLVIELTADRIDALASALEPDFYVSRGAMSEAVAESRAFNAIHLETAIKVDLFVRGDRPFDIEEFRRRRPIEISREPSLVVPIKTVEDSVLRKLRWYRDGGESASQQWRDVVALIAFNADSIDHNHLSHWARELKVHDLLVRALQEAVE